MNEKEFRFTKSRDSRIIIDRQTKIHYLMSLDWEVSLVVRLLNELYCDNVELKKKLDEYKVYENLWDF